MKTDANDAGVDTPSNGDRSPTETPPPQPKPAPTMTPMEAFENDPDFQQKTVEMAKKLASVAYANTKQKLIDETRLGFVAKLKSDAIKNELDDFQELAYLLPDVDDPAVMRHAAENLRMRLRMFNPLRGDSGERRSMSPLDRVNLGNELRKQRSQRY